VYQVDIGVFYPLARDLQLGSQSVRCVGMVRCAAAVEGRGRPPEPRAPPRRATFVAPPRPILVRPGAAPRFAMIKGKEREGELRSRIEISKLEVNEKSGREERLRGGWLKVPQMGDVSPERRSVETKIFNQNKSQHNQESSRKSRIRIRSLIL
jgi:hypothetical protein